ncbi:hypothetical protein M9H77_22938 [Catharanthus roseus]|uniref:Uncharacterized protein n=1 Tax=Catharanthus roseus TaxID=4058 RepID=A0ACC0ATE6_CATRO|nr:hypothetical protein M9H77_22938 [Catharanthus roseus]
MANELLDVLDTFNLNDDENQFIGLSQREVDSGLEDRKNSVFVVVYGGGPTNSKRPILIIESQKEAGNSHFTFSKVSNVNCSILHAIHRKLDVQSRQYPIQPSRKLDMRNRQHPIQQLGKLPGNDSTILTVNDKGGLPELLQPAHAPSNIVEKVPHNHTPS